MNFHIRQLCFDLCLSYVQDEPELVDRQFQQFVMNELASLDLEKVEEFCRTQEMELPADMVIPSLEVELPDVHLEEAGMSLLILIRQYIIPALKQALQQAILQKLFEVFSRRRNQSSQPDSSQANHLAVPEQNMKHKVDTKPNVLPDASRQNLFELLKSQLLYGRSANPDHPFGEVNYQQFSYLLDQSLQQNGLPLPMLRQWLGLPHVQRRIWSWIHQSESFYLLPTLLKRIFPHSVVNQWMLYLGNSAMGQSLKGKIWRAGLTFLLRTYFCTSTFERWGLFLRSFTLEAGADVTQQELMEAMRALRACLTELDMAQQQCVRTQEALQSWFTIVTMQHVSQKDLLSLRRIIIPNSSDVLLHGIEVSKKYLKPHFNFELIRHALAQVSAPLTVLSQLNCMPETFIKHLQAFYILAIKTAVFPADLKQLIESKCQSWLASALRPHAEAQKILLKIRACLYSIESSPQDNIHIEELSSHITELKENRAAGFETKQFLTQLYSAIAQQQWEKIGSLQQVIDTYIAQLTAIQEEEARKAQRSTPFVSIEFKDIYVACDEQSPNAMSKAAAQALIHFYQLLCRPTLTHTQLQTWKQKRYTWSQDVILPSLPVMMMDAPSGVVIQENIEQQEQVFKQRQEQAVCEAIWVTFVEATQHLLQHVIKESHPVLMNKMMPSIQSLNQDRVIEVNRLSVYLKEILMACLFWQKQESRAESGSAVRLLHFSRYIEKLESMIQQLFELGQNDPITYQMTQQWWWPIFHAVRSQDKQVQQEANMIEAIHAWAFSPVLPTKSEVLETCQTWVSECHEQSIQQSLKRMSDVRLQTKKQWSQLDLQSIRDKINARLAQVRQWESEQYTGLPTKDAGLVILWPFLQLFFQRNNLLNIESDTTADTDKIGHFMDEQTQEKAFAYLVEMSGLVFEEQEVMGTANLMLGLPPETSHEALIELSNEEKESVTAFLQSVIGHWQALKNMPVGSFQQMFIQRHGLCIQTQHGFAIEVERQSMDILLTKLPWGLGTITMPWLDHQLLEIHWPYGFD
ncbi:contractile injection system tape measure protein [Algicola sagamiensis]|uniref:contractile injection system tape measure protein n=1 Tax=Algicola sagamiensis TaxID=163869 RepID=UPI00037F3831|nr:contractile injection system tape measure protein [Algicola sagamiensis]